jgi:hypothetical protein
MHVCLLVFLSPVLHVPQLLQLIESILGCAPAVIHTAGLRNTWRDELAQLFTALAGECKEEEVAKPATEVHISSSD